MNRIFLRDIKPKIEQDLKTAQKVLIVFGPRQVGKTTLVKQILRDFDSEAGYCNCEENRIKDVLLSGNPDEMYQVFGQHKVVVFDEAQTVPNIGLALKLMIDTYPEMKIIATGSSSFELANRLNEPLTGRKFEYFLPPLSVNEIWKNYSRYEVTKTLNNLLIYGSYPEVVLAKTKENKLRVLDSLTTSYLYKDVLIYNNIRNPELLTRILRALARQVGSEVNYSEIGQAAGVERRKVEEYIRLLEQAFIIFRLTPLTRNRRDEIKKLRKIYFYDNGILNNLINDFNDETTGRDMGPLWENMLVSERIKRLQTNNMYRHIYYWRLKSGAEVDYIEEYDGKLVPFEFKYRKAKINRGAETFVEEYKKQGAQPVTLINRTNFLGFVAQKSGTKQ
jgi:predicted AAA+ superfamily ATPase